VSLPANREFGSAEASPSKVTENQRRQWQQAQPPRCLARAGAGQLPVSHGIGPLAPVATAEAKTESFLISFVAPQCGQAAAPADWADRTSNSKSFVHLGQ